MNIWIGAEDKEMKYDISKKLNAVINQASGDWETIHRSFNDEKATEFEVKHYRPLIDEARQTIQWFQSLEIEMEQAERNINLPVP